MLIQFALGTVLICLTVLIHAFVLDRLIRFMEGWGARLFRMFRLLWKVPMLMTAVLGVFCSHIVQIWIWAGVYLFVRALPDFETALYFSTVTFTTVGFGDIVLDKSWRLMSAFQAANGFILFGCSTAFVFEVLSKLYERETGPKNAEGSVMRGHRFFVVCLVFFLCVSPAAYADFQGWLKDLKHEARLKGVSDRTLSDALDGVSFLSRVVELDRKQPEGRMSFRQYYENVITPERVSTGRAMYQAHRTLLEEIGQAYGVAPEFIVALWGIETSYGRNTGGFDVVPALATLAYDGRRPEFFRAELIQALKIIDSGHISADRMQGSWAGAMGQNQFMPSSFQNFAVDGNGDGRRDIWSTLPDVFASTANYLARSGWQEDERWGRHVSLPQDFSQNFLGLETEKTLGEWARLGVRFSEDPDGIQKFSRMRASLLAPDGLSGPAFLVYRNTRVIMKWNKSTYFATAVGLLADQIAR